MEVFKGGEKGAASVQPVVIVYTTLTCVPIWTKFTEALTKIPWCDAFAGRNAPASFEKCGQSEDLLKDFYKLLVRTRARHDLPPQPYEWFQNLIDCLGDTLTIRLAYKDATPVAAILTLRFRDSVFYKYGASDVRYKHLGAMPLLLWMAIRESKSTGAKEFSLGRSDEDNAGLITFKNHWTRSTPLVYWRYPGPVWSGIQRKLES